MTPERAREVLDLIERADDHFLENLTEHSERFLDGIDRQLAQVAQMKLLNDDEPVSDVVKTLLEAAISAPNPTEVI